MTAVHEGFRVAIPFAAASSPAPFATAGTLALPSAGGTALELRGRAGPGMATRFDVWNYGALSGFDAPRCP
ncbi:MAG: hypothetical protein J6T01_02280, partial [Kiritimatiellae bacterium]|nr:hypothetical protein [Kiritimatiellia bacterium]